MRILKGEKTVSSINYCCCCSVAKSCPTLCNPMICSMPGFPVLHYLPESAQTHVHWVSDSIQPSHILSSPSLLVLNLSPSQDLFQWVGSLHQVAKVWSFSLSTSPSNEYSGLTSFRIDWFDLFAVQGTLKSSSAPHFKIINSSMLSLLHGPTLAFYITTGKIIALAIQTFVGSDVSLQ